MKKGIKTVLVLGLLLIASVFVVSAYQGYGNGTGPGTYERGTFHDTMEEIVEEGTYEDLVSFRAENGGFGGPRWVTDEASFNEWKERHEAMEEAGYGPGYMNGGQRGSGFGGGCPMRGY